MSNMEHWTGTATKIEFPEEITSFESKINFLKKRGHIIEEVYIDEEWFYCKTLAKFNNIFYHIAKVEIDDQECKARQEDDGSISFTLNFYNGGASFGEALEDAMEKAGINK